MAKGDNNSLTKIFGGSANAATDTAYNSATNKNATDAFGGVTAAPVNAIAGPTGNTRNIGDQLTGNSGPTNPKGIGSSPGGADSGRSLGGFNPATPVMGDYSKQNQFEQSLKDAMKFQPNIEGIFNNGIPNNVPVGGLTNNNYQPNIFNAMQAIRGR